MRTRHVDVIGGGPGGLFLARLVKAAEPSITVRVHERNDSDDSSGFGVVFSDRTMSTLRAADTETCDLIRDASVSWSGMEMRLPSETLYYGGYGFSAIARTALLRILRSQARRVDVDLVFGDQRVLEEPRADPEHVVVLADGANSANRARLAERFGTTVTPGSARYIWLATPAPFDTIVFPFVRTKLGSFGAHVYPYGDGMSTFIAEVDGDTWREHGMDDTTARARASGGSDERSRELLQEVFSDHLGGYPLLGNKSRWETFRVVRNRRWWAGNTVLLGDAAHTAHFSVGSGTKLAMEDAIVLAGEIGRAGPGERAFSAYQATRHQPVARTQELAERSMRWWETFDKRMDLPPHRFGMHFLTRTDAIDYAGFTRRHRERTAETESEFASLAAGRPVAAPEHALESPIALGPLRLPNRVAVPLSADAPPELAVGAASAGGASLIIADRRGSGALPRDSRGWRTAADGVAEFGATLGMVVSPEQHRAVRAGHAHLVEVVLDNPDELGAVDAVLDTLGGDAAVCAGITCPSGPSRSPEADALLDRCAVLGELGVAGLHLRGAGDVDWDNLLEWADRVRTETGIAVLLDGPAGWALRVRRDQRDDWSTRLHLALVSGRADMIVSWPLNAPRMVRGNPLRATA